MSTDIPSSDYIALKNIVFDWARAYDSKDWPLLESILTPKSTFDYRALLGPEGLHADVAPDAVISLLKTLIGDVKLRTHHLVGASKFEISNDGQVVNAWHQLRVTHQLYADEDLQVVKGKGDAHGVVRHQYRRIEGQTWKLEVVEPTVNFVESGFMETLAKDEEKKA